MRRPELEHVIRAAGSIVNSRCLVIIGSQAILGQFPDAPAVFLRSIEADVYPQDDPAKAEIIEGAMGEESPFHIHFGYYAHGVGPETAVLPPGFEDRLVEIRNDNTNGYSGLCLEVHDLAVSKLVAGREKDFSFVQELLGHGLVLADLLNFRADSLNVDGEQKSLVQGRIARLRQASGHQG